MTIQRLEEIAAWAEKYVLLCKQYGTTEDKANYGDLARCARAWAKVESVKQSTGNHTWIIDWDRHGFTLDTAWDGEHGRHLSAIEAVEAATLACE